MCTLHRQKRLSVWCLYLGDSVWCRLSACQRFAALCLSLDGEQGRCFKGHMRAHVRMLRCSSKLTALPHHEQAPAPLLREADCSARLPLRPRWRASIVGQLISTVVAARITVPFLQAGPRGLQSSFTVHTRTAHSWLQYSPALVFKMLHSHRLTGTILGSAVPH